MDVCALFSSECEFILSKRECDERYILTESELRRCNVIEHTRLCS